MSENNLFEIASRLKLRFESPVGSISVEDIWDLPLTSSTASRLNLDSIAKGLHRELKSNEEESFVIRKSTKNVVLETKFELVKYVISFKLEEAEQCEKRAENRVRRDKLRSILAQKQDDVLSSKSVKQIEKLLQEVED